MEKARKSKQNDVNLFLWRRRRHFCFPRVFSGLSFSLSLSPSVSRCGECLSKSIIVEGLTRNELHLHKQ